MTLSRFRLKLETKVCDKLQKKNMINICKMQEDVSGKRGKRCNEETHLALPSKLPKKILLYLPNIFKD